MGLPGPMPGAAGLVHSAAMASSDQTRLLLVEDVPQVAQYIRGLLNSQSSVKLLDVLSDGSKVLAQVQQLRPGRRPRRRPAPGPGQGPAARRADPASGLGVPVIVLTVPQNPVEIGLRQGHPRRPRDAVLGLRPDEPDRARSARSSPSSSTTGSSRIYSVFAPKGGVGKTTIAFNLAVALGQAEQRTVLIDG